MLAFSYKWTRLICGFAHLPSPASSLMISRFARGWSSSASLRSFVVDDTDCMERPCVFHSSVDLRLGSPRFSAVMNAEHLCAGFVRMYVFSSLAVYLGVEFLGRRVTPSLPFCRTARLFARRLHDSATPPARHEGSDFSTSWPTLVIFFVVILIIIGIPVGAHLILQTNFS